MNGEEATRKNLEGLKLLETAQYDEAIKLFSETIESRLAKCQLAIGFVIMFVTVGRI